MVLVACNQSKKGDWNDEDKQKAKDEMAKVESQLSVLGDKKDVFINCYLEKVEDNYTNFEEANKDQPGCTKLATECAGELFK